MYTLYNRFVYTQHNEKREGERESEKNWNEIMWTMGAHIWEYTCI